MVEGPGVGARVVEFDGVLANVAELEAGAIGFGLVNTQRDPDGVVRQVPLLMSVAGQPVPSLALEALRVAVGANWLTLHTDENGLTGVELGDSTLATDPDGKVTLYYSHSDPRRRHSAAAVLNGEVPDDALAGRIALIGVTALGLTDVVPTPVEGSMDGVEVHVQVIETVLDGVRLIRPWFARWVELGFLAITGVLIIAWIPRLRPAYGALLVVAVLTAFFGVSFAAFAQAQRLFDPSQAAVTLSVIYVFLLASMLAESNRKRRQLNAAFESQRLESARMAGELGAAREIQLGMLPRPDAIEDLPPTIRLHALLEPAREVGGDLYDVYMVDERQVFFLVADVSGKGVPASLFMALSKALCKSVALRDGAAVGMVTKLNEAMSRENPGAFFVTAITGVIDTETGEGEFCIAGHDAPYRFKPGDTPQELTSSGGPPLCVLDDFTYPSERFHLAPGEMLLLWTDGVGEAQAR